MAHAGGSITRVDWLLLIALSILWGGSFFFIGVAVRQLPPLTIVASRLLLAVLVLFALVRLTGSRMPMDRRVWAAFLGMGILNNAIPFTLIVWGQSRIASGVASVLNATTPLFTVIVAHYWTGNEKITSARLVGVLVGFTGVAVMIGTAPFLSFDGSVLAQAACLVAALSYAFAGVFGKRFKMLGITPMQAATGQLAASSFLLLPLAVLVDRPWTLAAPSAGGIMALLGLALLSTALAYILYFRILSTAGPTNLLLVTFLIPVTATVLGILFLGEAIYARHAAGAALIGCGLAAIDGRPLRMLKGMVAPRV